MHFAVEEVEHYYTSSAVVLSYLSINGEPRAGERMKGVITAGLRIAGLNMNGDSTSGPMTLSPYVGEKA